MTEEKKDQPEANEPRMVDCVKLGRRLPGLASPPRPDELGKRIFEHVSAQAWQLWLNQQTILINHYGLNMADPQAREFLTKQLEEFFFGEGAQMPEDWVPEGQGSDKGGPSAKGGPSGPSAKGAPAPARK
jgi:Fe-S cluster biosynthesis and repair protein YggX